MTEQPDATAYLAAVVARYQPILDALPKQETTPGATDWLVAEMNEWAPYRAEANARLLGDDAR